MLRLWDVDNELVAACVEHISSKRLQDNLAKIEKLQVSERRPRLRRNFEVVIQSIQKLLNLKRKHGGTISEKRRVIISCSLGPLFLPQNGKIYK